MATTPPLPRRSLSDLLNVTRGSVGTYFDAAGRYRSAAVDAPRFTFNPDTLARRGLLIEPERTNKALRNTALTNAAWDAAGYPVTVTAAAFSALGGTVSMFSIAGSGGAGYHALRQSAIATAAGQVETISALVKKNGTRYVVLGDANDAAWHAVTFDFDTETFTGQTNATGRLVEKCADGVYRIACTFTRTDAGTILAGIGPSPNANDGSFPNYTPAGESLYAALPQVEAGGYPTSIIETAAATVARSADVVVIAAEAWFNPEAGAVFLECELLGQTVGGTAAALISLSDGTADELVAIREQQATIVGADLFARAAAATIVDTASNAYSAVGATEKHAFRYAADDYAYVKNGGAAKVDTAGGLPTLTGGHIGFIPSGATAGLIVKRLRARPAASPDATLQTYTT